MTKNYDFNTAKWYKKDELLGKNFLINEMSKPYINKFGKWTRTVCLVFPDGALGKVSITANSSLDNEKYTLCEVSIEKIDNDQAFFYVWCPPIPDWKQAQV